MTVACGSPPTRSTSITRARVRVRQCERFDRAYPAHYGASVTIGGETSVAEDALGDPERPMSDAQVREKARALMAHGGVREPSELIEAVLSGDLAEISKMLSA